MRDWHCGSEAAHAVLRVSARRVAERTARKNELEFWSRRETGTQDWKVEFWRKEAKKLGQLAEVKLLPREVSKGEGRADGARVPEGTVSVTVGVMDTAGCAEDGALELETGTTMFVLVEEVVGEEASAVDVGLLESLLSWRCLTMALGNGGGSRRSK